MNMDEIKARASQMPPVDPNVKLPAAIRAAAARSDAIHGQAYSQEGEEGKKDEGKQEPEKGQEANGGTEGKQEKANPEAGKEGKASEKPAASAPSQTPSEWEHKYNSLKGRFDQQTATISQLTTHVEQLQRELIQATKQQPQRTPDTTFSITPEEAETYGQDFLDVAARAAGQKLSPEIAALKEHIARLEAQVGQVGSTVTKTAQQQMYDFLDEKLPNWRQINRDPKFIAWTNLQDVLSGAIRGSMMRDAFGKNDASRVLSFFTAYLSDEAATAPANHQPDTPKGGKIPLEELAAPGRAKAPAASASTPGEKEKPLITRAQISQFYLDVNRGKYKGNEAEKDRLERMIFEAEQEGRVV